MSQPKQKSEPELQESLRSVIVVWAKERGLELSGLRLQARESNGPKPKRSVRLTQHKPDESFWGIVSQIEWNEKQERVLRILREDPDYRLTEAAADLEEWETRDVILSINVKLRKDGCDCRITHVGVGNHLRGPWRLCVVEPYVVLSRVSFVIADTRGVRK